MKGKTKKKILVVNVKRSDRANGLFAASLASVPVVYNLRNSWSSDTYIFSSLVFGFYRIKGKLFIQKRAKNKPLFKTYSKMKSVHIKVHVVRTTLRFEEWISDTLHKQLSSLVFTTLQFRKAKMPTFSLCHVAIAFEFFTSDIEYCSWSKVKSPSILLNAS